MRTKPSGRIDAKSETSFERIPKFYGINAAILFRNPIIYSSIVEFNLNFPLSKALHFCWFVLIISRVLVRTCQMEKEEAR